MHIKKNEKTSLSKKYIYENKIFLMNHLNDHLI